MKKIKYIIAEYILGKIENIKNRKHSPSFLAYAVVSFTEEAWLDGIVRQGRFYDYLANKA